MTRKELKKIFGDDLQTIEVKPPAFDVPEEFDNFAVHLPKELDTVNVVKAKIMPAEEVKCHGVIPMSKECREKYANLPPDQQPFNCCVGDYTEMRCKVWVKGISTTCISSVHSSDEMDFNVKHQWGMPEDVASGMCAEEEIGELIPLFGYADSADASGWYGYFKTEADAKKALALKIASERKIISSKLDKLNDLETKIEQLL